MLYLIASFIALSAGPLCYRFMVANQGIQKGLDGFVFVSLGGLVLIHILPELIEHGGWVAILLVVLGIWGPSASEKLFHRYSDITHKITLYLGVFGLLIHTLTDGGALVLASQPEHANLLALGIILHRLPVGIAIWWLLKPQVGSKIAAMVITFMMVLTALGYFAGQHWLENLSMDNTVYLQAFVTGSILHVVLHQPHVDHNERADNQYQFHSGIGSIIGIVFLLFLFMAEDPHEHMQTSHEHTVNHLWQWGLSISPAILLSLCIALLRTYLLKQCPPINALQRLQQIVVPEAWVLTFLILGFPFVLLHILASLLIVAIIALRQPPYLKRNDNSLTANWYQASLDLIDHATPIVMLFFITLNLISLPAGWLAMPIVQLLILTLIFVFLRINSLASVIIAAALYYQGWHPSAVIFTLIFAPLFNIKSLMRPHIASTLLLFFAWAACIYGGTILPLNPAPIYVWNEPTKTVTVAIISVLFAGSLLRLGPRKFIQQLMRKKVHNHHHH